MQIRIEGKSSCKIVLQILIYWQRVRKVFNGFELRVKFEEIIQMNLQFDIWDKLFAIQIADNQFDWSSKWAVWLLKLVIDFLSAFKLFEFWFPRQPRISRSARKMCLVVFNLCIPKVLRFKLSPKILKLNLINVNFHPWLNSIGCSVFLSVNFSKKHSSERLAQDMRRLTPSVNDRGSIHTTNTHRSLLLISLVDDRRKFA